ncbi:MAG: TonB-dependent receptor, partial [Burkholderiales bacterium]|nr:TonB-dependent receptor [Burkholderiales bacterium]
MKKNKMIAGCIQRTAMSLAISVCFATLAQAQNADGTIYGHAKAKEQIHIVSIENGSTRTIEAGKDGDFTVPRLPSGQYKVTANGVTKDVVVVVGSGTEVRFDVAQTVTVTSSRVRNPIDVSSSESNVVYTRQQVLALPVGQDATSIALLAPGTVQGVGSFGGLASFGGSSVAENGYFINGFDVTNIHRFMSFFNLPFEALNEQQVKTGGYGAEFGRSLGGVINSTTKRGTNEWKFGMSSTFSSSSLNNRDTKIVKSREKEDIDNGNTYIYYTNPANRFSNLNYALTAGGPIIKDKLFMFGMLQGNRYNSDGYGNTGSNTFQNNSPQGLLKLDWQLSENHRLEFTGINNSGKSANIGYNALVQDPNHPSDPNLHYSTTHIGQASPTSTKYTNEFAVAKYTGYLTDNLTLSAQIGRTKNSSRFIDPRVFGSECPAIYFNGAWQGGCFDPNHPTVRDAKAPDDGDTRKGKRLDVEYNFGDHTLRAGYDGQDFISTNAGYTYSGGIYYRYYTQTNAAGTVNGVANAVPLGSEYVRVRHFQTTTGAYDVQNNAMYLEDSWKVAKNIMLIGGLRSESFANKNADGVSFLKKDNLIAPRLGAVWDVNGDASMKVFGNAGRYYIPVASNINIRASNAEYLIGQFHSFTGKDPKTLAPLSLGPQIGSSIITGSLQAPNPATLADTELKPMSQDELILGFQKALSKDWTIGVKSVYRKVQNGMDDYCSSVGIAQWATDHGYTKFNPNTIPTCMVLNPGNDLHLAIDLNNDGKLTTVMIPNSYLGLAKYTRSYKALELTLDHPFDGKWGVTGSYTYSQTKGTAEGYVQSDLQQDDAGGTQDFDFGSFTDGAYGRTANDRTHHIKINGNYAINDNFRLGGVFDAASGRPTSCLGFVPPTVKDFYGPDG